jgi:hypothetical protein
MQAFPVIGCNWLDGLHAGLGIAVKNTWDKRDIGTPTDKPGSFIYLRVPVSVPSLSHGGTGTLRLTERCSTTNTEVRNVEVSDPAKKVAVGPTAGQKKAGTNGTAGRTQISLAISDIYLSQLLSQACPTVGQG